MQVGKCCPNKEKFFIVYQCGTKTEKWLVCDSCSKENLFQIYIKERYEL